MFGRNNVSWRTRFTREEKKCVVTKLKYLLVMPSLFTEALLAQILNMWKTNWWQNTRVKARSEARNRERIKRSKDESWGGLSLVDEEIKDTDPIHDSEGKNRVYIGKKGDNGADSDTNESITFVNTITRTQHFIPARKKKDSVRDEKYQHFKKRKILLEQDNAHVPTCKVFTAKMLR